MDKITEILPNQVTCAATEENKAISEYNINKIRKNTENISKLHQENKEIMEYVHSLKNVKEESIFVRGILHAACIMLTGVAGYWIIQVILTYRSQPVMATTHIIENKTFEWPTVTIEPAAACLNTTALAQLKMIHNFTSSDYYPTAPFNISNSDFNWSTNNVSEMYQKTRIIPANLIFACFYKKRLGEGTSNCRKLGEWETYASQYNDKMSFTPVAASSILDSIQLHINATLCKLVTVSIHPSTDRFYDAHSSALHFGIRPNRKLMVRLAVEEFNRINTRASPCIEDVSYSQTECFEAKIIAYKIQRAGCYFVGITGNQQLGNYPECNNASLYNNFMYWHKEVSQAGLNYNDLQNMKDECVIPCHTKRYTVTETIRSHSRDRRSSIFWMFMDPRAMSYLRVDEKSAMTLDELVANVGGTLGLFLGISCITAVSTLQYVIKKATKMLCKVYDNKT